MDKKMGRSKRGFVRVFVIFCVFRGGKLWCFCGGLCGKRGVLTVTFFGFLIRTGLLDLFFGYSQNGTDERGRSWEIAAWEDGHGGNVEGEEMAAMGSRLSQGLSPTLTQKQGQSIPPERCGKNFTATMETLWRSWRSGFEGGEVAAVAQHEG